MYILILFFLSFFVLLISAFVCLIVTKQIDIENFQSDPFENDTITPPPLPTDIKHKKTIHKKTNAPPVINLESNINEQIECTTTPPPLPSNEKHKRKKNHPVINLVKRLIPPQKKANALKVVSDLPYIKRKLFTHNEEKFFRLLQKTAQQKFIIMAKIRLWDVIDTEHGMPYNKKIIYQNKIRQKHLDFVLVTLDSLQIILAIELDDKSHEKEEAQKRDDIKNAALESVNIPLLRIKTSDKLTPESLYKKIIEKIPDFLRRSEH